jgi:hypothetical protein
MTCESCEDCKRLAKRVAVLERAVEYCPDVVRSGALQPQEPTCKTCGGTEMILDPDEPIHKRVGIPCPNCTPNTPKVEE